MFKEKLHIATNYVNRVVSSQITGTQEQNK